MFGILTGLLAVASATPIFNASVTEGSMNATWGGNEVGIIPVTNMGCWSVKLEADETFVATWKLAQWGREHHIGAGAIHGEYYGNYLSPRLHCKPRPPFLTLRPASRRLSRQYLSVLVSGKDYFAPV